MNELDQMARDSQRQLDLMYRPMKDFLESDLGVYVMRSIDSKIAAFTQQGDQLTNEAALRCYDAARGAREVKNIFTYPIEMKESGQLDELKKLSAATSP